MTRPSAAARRDTARVFLALATLPTAVTVVRALGPTARQARSGWLAYPPATGRFADAAAILAGNARVAALVLGATLLAASAPATATPLALLLAAAASLNVALLCVALTADGTSAALALLPHGPVELLAFSILAAGFLHARRHGRATSPRTIAITTATGLLLLAVAAALEVTPV
jgi:hypothetical protein